MIEVIEQFPVPAPPHAVWQLLADPYAVVGCVPGAAIVGQADDGTLDTTLTVKFGPVSVSFQAQATLELEPDLLRGRLSAHGKDKQGGARFQATATFSVVAAGNGALEQPAEQGALEQPAGQGALEQPAEQGAREQPAEKGSLVMTQGQVEISGRLASLIEGGASVVVKRMSAEFARCLSARCQA